MPQCYLLHHPIPIASTSNMFVYYFLCTDCCCDV